MLGPFSQIPRRTRHGCKDASHIPSTTELCQLDGDFVRRREWMPSALFPGVGGVGRELRWLIDDAGGTIFTRQVSTLTFDSRVDLRDDDPGTTNKPAAYQQTRGWTFPQRTVRTALRCQTDTDCKFCS